MQNEDAHDQAPPCHINANTTHFSVKRIAPDGTKELVRFQTAYGVSEQEWPNSLLTNRWVRDNLGPGEYRFCFLQKSADGKKQARGESAAIQVVEPNSVFGRAPVPAVVAPPPPAPAAAPMPPVFDQSLQTALLLTDAIAQRADAQVQRDREMFMGMQSMYVTSIDKITSAQNAQAARAPDPVAALAPVLQQLADGQRQLGAVIAQQGQTLQTIAARVDSLENDWENDEEEDDDETPTDAAPPIDPSAPIGETLITQGKHALIQHAPMIMGAIMEGMSAPAAKPAAAPPPAPPASTPLALPEQPGTRVA